MPAAPGAIVGIGDDAAVLRVPDPRIVATTDLLVQGRHFRTEWSGPVDIGGKAAARSLADVAAMGAVPVALLVGLAAPSELPVAWAQDFASGLAEEAARGGAHVIGGDVSQASPIMVAVTAIGALAGGEPVTRSGARPSDVVAVAGRLGHSAAGLALLQAGRTERRFTSARVFEVRIAAVDQNVAGREQRRQLLNRLVDGRAGGDHHHDPPRAIEILHERFERFRAGELSLA